LAGSSCTGRQDGRYLHASDCSKYIWCVQGSANVMSCQQGLHWNPSADACDWPDNANCVERDESLIVTDTQTSSTTPSSGTNKQ